MNPGPRSGQHVMLPGSRHLRFYCNLQQCTGSIDTLRLQLLPGPGHFFYSTPLTSNPMLRAAVPN
jgi:hypothetical protein